MNRKSTDRINDENGDHIEFYSSADLEPQPAPPASHSSKKPLLDQIFPLHVFEDDNKIVVRAILYGFTRKQIEVRLGAGEITILVTLPAKFPKNGQDQAEGSTKLQRNYRFSMTVNPRLSTAIFQDGMLQVEIPKEPGGFPRGESEVVITEEEMH